jgi:hypothetical protein
MEFVSGKKNKKKDVYLGEGQTLEVDSLGNQLTPEQSAFFKNSKVRDRQGKLLVCNHFTDNKFDGFDKSFIGTSNGMDYGSGFYFSATELDWYGSNKMVCYLNIRNPFTLDLWTDGGREQFFTLLSGCGYDEDIEYYRDDAERIVDNYGSSEFLDMIISPTELTNICVKKGYDGIVVGDVEKNEIIAFEPNQIKSITNTNPTSSNKLNENDTTNTITLYRVGELGKGTFFTDSLDYYSQSMTGYKKEEAKTYTIDLSMAKVFDPMKELSLYPNTWSDIEGKVEDFEKYNIDYESDSPDAIWGRTSTDDIAYAVKDLGYDVLILRDIRGDYGTGNPFNEYIIYNTDLLKPVDNINEELLSESLHKLGSNCFITDSPYDIKNLIMNKPKLYRILYDSNIDMYMIGDGNEIIHWDMIREAERQGYYANQEEFIDELGGTLDNYVETGTYGLYDDDYEVDPYLLYIIFSPDDEEFMLGEDGYDGQLKFNFGYLFLRDADQGVMDNCDLLRILQKQSWANVNESISRQDEKAVREFARDCIEDRLPFMDYKEFADTLSEQGMTVNKDLFQIYTDEYKNMAGGYDGDLEIADKIINEFLKMTTEQIVKLVNIPHRDQIDTNSPMFILPNGTIVSVKEVGENLGYNTSWVHGDLMYIILDTLANNLGLYYPTEMEDAENNLLEHLTNELGWARINCGTTWTEDRFYCVLPDKMTTSQFRSLEKWIEWGYDNHKGDDEVLICFEHTTRAYEFKDNFPEDIIKKIKRYYSSGKLYENRKELKETMNDNDMNIHPQVAKELEYYRRIAESPYNKGSRREYENIDNYKEYQKEIDRNGDKNLLVYGRFSNPNEYRRYTVDEIKKNNKVVYAVPFARRYKDSDLLVHRPDSGGEILVNIEDIVVVKNVNEMKENMNNGYRMDNGMIEDDYFTFERDNITYHFFFKPTRRTDKGQYAILAVDYGIRFDKEPYKDEKGHTIIPTSRVHDKPQQLAYFEFNEDTHPEIAYAMTEDDRKEYRDLVVAETKKHINGSMNEEFVSELVPGELYHFIHNNRILYGTFKRKTPAWLFFDVEGKEVLAKPWTSVATTTEELEELIGLVNKMERDTKIPPQVPNRFTRVPNQHNKPMGESNELEQRAKKHKKKSKGMGWHMSMNAGDVEKGIEVFNNSTSLGNSSSGGEGTAMGESVKGSTYCYNGPIYYDGREITSHSNICTTAPSFNVALRNILYKAASGDKELYHYDIVDELVKEVRKDTEIKQSVTPREKCYRCGYELNDMGDCPVCDYGEDDLLESLSDLEALWKLSNLD